MPFGWHSIPGMLAVCLYMHIAYAAHQCYIALCNEAWNEEIPIDMCVRVCVCLRVVCLLKYNEPVYYIPIP